MDRSVPVMERVSRGIMAIAGRHILPAAGDVNHGMSDAAPVTVDSYGPLLADRWALSAT